MGKFKLPKFDAMKFLLFIVLSLLFVGVISFLVSSVFPKIPVLKVGVPFLLITVGLAIILPFMFIIKDGSLDGKDIFGIIIYALIVLAIVAFLPKLLPQFFDTIPQLSESINIFQSAIGLN